jgi:hypothetical protein
LITADQLLAHAVGDYVLQSDWMATNKSSRTIVALIHALCYAIPFLLFSPSALGLAVIIGSHLVIDRFRLAGWLNWLKNGLPRPRTLTGFPADRPEYLVVWLVIITDNILHIAINGAALRWL